MIEIQSNFKNQLNQISRFLQILEIPLVFVSIVWLIYFGITLENSCITGICRSTPFIQGNLYNTALSLVIPILAFVGLTRLSLNYAQTHSDTKKSLSFHLGIVSLFCGYLILSFFSKDFLYFNNKNEVQVDSLYLLYEIATLGISSIILLRDKKVWDTLTFFSKIRLFFYLFSAVLILINLNFGILIFLILTPVLLFIDKFKQAHISWE
jgi:hypothetical protein